MDFKFVFSLSEQDYLDFNMFHTFESKTGKKQYTRLRLMTSGLFLAAGILYLLLYGFNSDGFVYLGAFSLLAVVFYFIYKPLLRASVKRQIKFYKKQGKLPYSPKATMTFGEACFTEVTETNKSEYVYSLICDAYIVNDRKIYLYISQVQAFILPVSAFESKTQLDAFLTFIGEKAVPVTESDFERSPYMEPIFPENSNK